MNRTNRTIATTHERIHCAVNIITVVIDTIEQQQFVTDTVKFIVNIVFAVVFEVIFFDKFCQKFVFVQRIKFTIDVVCHEFRIIIDVIEHKQRHVVIVAVTFDFFGVFDFAIVTIAVKRFIGFKSIVVGQFIFKFNGTRISAD